MISETITIPKTISDQEDRFVLKLKENLLRMIKEINKNSKKISEINGEEHEDPDYTDEFNKKADVNASNIGYGDLFLEIKDDEGEVIYSEEDNRKDWGKALTNSKNTIASDNVTLVSSQNVYDETHPYMEKDSSDHWINPYHYINYKNLSRREGAEDINKQDRWSEQEFYEPNEPNDNTVKENLVALDTAIWEVEGKLDDKANISLDNINHTGGLVINAIARGSTIVQDRTALGEQDPLVKVAHQEVQDPETGLYTDIYTVYSDYDPSGGGDQDNTLYAQILGWNVGENARYNDIYGFDTRDTGNTNKPAWKVIRDIYFNGSGDVNDIMEESFLGWGEAIGCSGVRDAYNKDGRFLANLNGTRYEVDLPLYLGDSEADFINRRDWDEYIESEDYAAQEVDFNLENILDYADTTGQRLGSLQEAIFQLGASMLSLKNRIGEPINYSGNAILQPFFTTGRVKTVTKKINNVDTTCDRNAYLNYYISGSGYLGLTSNSLKFPMTTSFSEETGSSASYTLGINDQYPNYPFSERVVVPPVSDRRFKCECVGSFGTEYQTNPRTDNNLYFNQLPLFTRIEAMAETVDALASQVNGLTHYVGWLYDSFNTRISALERNSGGSGGSGGNS